MTTFELAHAASGGIAQTAQLNTANEQTITTSTVFDAVNANVVLLQAIAGDCSVQMGTTSQTAVAGTGLSLVQGSSITVELPKGAHIASDVEISVIPWENLD